MARNKAIQFRIPISEDKYIAVHLNWIDALSIAAQMVRAVAWSMWQSGAEAVGVTVKLRKYVSFHSWTRVE